MNRFFPLTLMGLSLLAGCASIQDKQARGNVIIIAKYDSRSPENGPNNARLVTDNAGGLPSAVAGAAGMPTTAAGGAALNVGVGLAANLISGAIYKDRIFVAFKVLYENTCEYHLETLDLRFSPESQNLFPGYVARVDGDKEDHLMVVPAKDAAGHQIYLTKAHPCYAAWVTEWKEHQRVLSSKATNWDVHKHAPLLFGAVPLDRFPDPALEWVK